MIDVKTDIKKFIDNVMKRDYQKSSNNLSDVIDQKINVFINESNNLD